MLRPSGRQGLKLYVGVARSQAEADARQAKLVRSHVRWRGIFVVLAVVLPALLFALFERQARRLDALGAHGKTTVATVAEITRQGSETFVGYRYAVAGRSYSWSVSAREAPYALGQSFVVSYLPEDPALTRPGDNPSVARTEAARNRTFTRKVIAGALAFIAVNAALSELKLRRLRKRGRAEGRADGRADAAASLLSPAWAGRLVALLCLAAVLVTNAYDDVAEVQRKAFGEAPLGLPVRAFVSIVESILFAPYFWVFEHLMRIAYRVIHDGASLSRDGHAPERQPDLRRSVAIAAGGLVYFVVLAGSWIAYASRRGL